MFSENRKEYSLNPSSNNRKSIWLIWDILKGERHMRNNETLKYLKRDRRVNHAFIERLSRAGFEIGYGTYSYWDYQMYIPIGEDRVWLVETESPEPSAIRCVYRRQNDVIEDIYRTIKEQKKVLKESDETVNMFFAKLVG